VGDGGAILRTVTGGSPPDDTRPATYALRKVTVRTGKMMRLRYRVNDVDDDLVAVRLQIKDAKGRQVKLFLPRKVATYAPLSLRVKCRLAPGHYRFSVTAMDRAGNAQGHTGSQPLVVTR